MKGARGLVVGLTVALTSLWMAGTGHAAGRAHTTGPGGSVRDAYWWQPEPVTGLIPAPGVPAGGLYVASSPSGTQAVSALSVTTPIDSGFVRLVLRVAQRQVVNPPSITAYPSTSRWQAGGPQPWSSRPRYNGSAPLCVGVYNIAQTRMSLVVPAFALAHGIELLPSPTPGANFAPSFAISFRTPLVTAVSRPTTPTNPPSQSTSPTSGSTSPTNGPHSGTPTPTHSKHHTAKPGHHSQTPRPPSTTPVPSGGAPTTSPATALSNKGTDHDARNVVIVAAVLVALVGAAGSSVAWRRRRQDQHGQRRT